MQLKKMAADQAFARFNFQIGAVKKIEDDLASLISA